MGWLGTRLKRSPTPIEELAPPAPVEPEPSRPPVVLLIPDIAGVGSFRAHHFTDATAAANFIESSLMPDLWHTLHAFWALHQEPPLDRQTPIGQGEALVLIRSAPGSNQVYVVSFVDVESAQSFARFEANRGLSPALVSIYWASLVDVTEEPHGVCLSPALPPSIEQPRPAPADAAPALHLAAEEAADEEPEVHPVSADLAEEEPELHLISEGPAVSEEERPSAPEGPTSDEPELHLIPEESMRPAGPAPPVRPPAPEGLPASSVLAEDPPPVPAVPAPAATNGNGVYAGAPADDGQEALVLSFRGDEEEEPPASAVAVIAFEPPVETALADEEIVSEDAEAPAPDVVALEPPVETAVGDEEIAAEDTEAPAPDVFALEPPVETAVADEEIVSEDSETPAPDVLSLEPAVETAVADEEIVPEDTEATAPEATAPEATTPEAAVLADAEPAPPPAEGQETAPPDAPEDIAAEVEKILRLKRWEKKEHPFKGFDSPPGRF